MGRSIASLLALVIAVVVLLDRSEAVTCAATTDELLAGIRDARGSIPTNGLLMEVAQRRAEQIVTNFSHDDGGLREEMLPGVRFAEILAWNSYPEDLTERVAIDQWLDSPEHRAILLDDEWTHVGVGVADSEPSHYYAALFAVFPETREPLPPTDTC